MPCETTSAQLDGAPFLLGVSVGLRFSNPEELHGEAESSTRSTRTKPWRRCPRSPRTGVPQGRSRPDDAGDRPVEGDEPNRCWRSRSRISYMIAADLDDQRHAPTAAYHAWPFHARQPPPWRRARRCGRLPMVAEMNPAACIAFAIDFNPKLKAPVTATGSALNTRSRTSNQGATFPRKRRASSRARSQPSWQARDCLTRRVNSASMQTPIISN
jgi:hypothetical protein